MSSEYKSINELKQMQSLPLRTKIKITIDRLYSWYNHYNGQVYLSFSGGKDSTVLRHIIDNRTNLDIPSVFVDTGLEYPEIRKFVKTFDNVDIIRPKMNFTEVIKKYGYPVISKEIARRIHYAKIAIDEGREESHIDYLKLCGSFLDDYGNKSHFNCEKWNHLLTAPFNCSAECCNVMKKKPFKEYNKTTGRVPIIGTLAIESRLRRQSWLKNGCNAFDMKIPRSTPMAIWTEQDILEYIITEKVHYCKDVYGDVIGDKKGKMKMSKIDRTGCMFCMFGCHSEKQPNRFQRMEKSHPKLYNFCINGGEEIDDLWQPNSEGLGLGRVLDFIGVEYKDGL